MKYSNHKKKIHHEAGRAKDLSAPLYTYTVLVMHVHVRSGALA